MASLNVETGPLLIALEAAVPLWIAEHRSTPPADRIVRAHQLADVIAAHGDDIMFRSSRKGKTAEAFNALAEGLALMSFAPGGVTFAGAHWEAT